MVLANPPYIDPADKEGLQPEVKLFEPPAALFGPVSGLDYPLEIIRETSYLMEGCFALLMEIGWDQADAVAGKCREAGFSEPEFINDYQDIKRILCIQKVNHG
jgi:release factor glutamine methyltransferase